MTRTRPTEIDCHVRGSLENSKQRYSLLASSVFFTIAIEVQNDIYVPYVRMVRGLGVGLALIMLNMILCMSLSIICKRC
ncbi:transmembrane protein, putative [Medicago truncatula]|uniref:Transmembrane protein, putative n=1 Tax=Medicago truncatula TaxID=3880 RepID=G7IHZ2_MEDTR|nr:transmembrane protein, putative [Medicago truncatula]